MIDREATPASPARRRRRRLLLLPLLALPAGALAVGVALADPSASFSVSDTSPSRNQVVTFTAADDCVAPVTCTWSGDVSGTGKQIEASFPSTGTRNVTLSIDDGADPAPGAESINMQQVVVQNTAPTAVISGPSSLNKNQAGQFSSQSTDPDPADTLTYAWNFGDGTTSNEANPPPHAWSTPGEKTVTLTVSDGAASDTDTHTVDVNDRPPTASFTAAPNPAGRNQLVTFTAASPADPDGDPVTYRWDFGDGVSNIETVSPTIQHSYAASGTRPVTLQVSSSGGSDTFTGSVTIQNAVPNTTSITGAPNPAQYNQPVGFTATATDADSLVTGFIWSWNGPGGNDGSEPAGAGWQHTFPVPGAYTVSAAAGDDEGDVDPTPASM